MQSTFKRRRGSATITSLYIGGTLAVSGALVATAAYPKVSWWDSVWTSAEEERLQRIADMVSCTVKVRYDGGHGSGVLFIVGEDVYCLTAAHVVYDSPPRNPYNSFPFGGGWFVPPRTSDKDATFGTKSIILSLHLQDEETFKDVLYNAELVAADGPTDVAILKVVGSTVKDFPGLKGAQFDLTNNKSFPKGTRTIHVGNWFDSLNAVSEGVICNPQQPLENGDGPLPEFRILQTTNMVGPGSSGGPLFLESNGKCIGLVVRVSTFPGDSISIPIYEAYLWAKSLETPLGYLFEEAA